MSGVIAGQPIRVYVVGGTLTDTEGTYLGEIAKNTTSLVDRPPYAVSPAGTFVIPNGANGTLVSPVDLGANYKLIVISCADCSGIPSSTNLSAQTGLEVGDTMCNLYEQDDPSTIWSASLPTSGTLRFALTHAVGSRRIRLVLSNNASANVTFALYGLDGNQYA